jgi:hypothetical protein
MFLYGIGIPVRRAVSLRALPQVPALKWNLLGGYFGSRGSRCCVARRRACWHRSSTFGVKPARTRWGCLAARFTQTHRRLQAAIDAIGNGSRVSRVFRGPIRFGVIVRYCASLRFFEGT